MTCKPHLQVESFVLEAITEGTSGSEEPDWDRIAPLYGDYAEDGGLRWQRVAALRCVICDACLPLTTRLHADAIELFPDNRGRYVYRLDARTDNRLVVKDLEIQGFHIKYAEIVVSVADGSRTWTFRSPVHAESNAQSKSGRRPTSKDDELAAATSLKRYLNELRGGDYEVDVVRSTSEYVDAFLHSRSKKPSWQVQITHFERDLIKNLRKGQLSRFLLNELPAKVQLAINSKQLVDPLVKSRTTLLLHSAVPIDSVSRSRLAASSYDARGFKNVFVSVDHDIAFQLCPKDEAAV